ncbi:hypothetical protein [Nocardia sp. NPDC057440]|uniref:hypothetical protein n=1 Tax=Nocardia sp. NPDC057440 TaxID=3346134 RepID=UPI00366D2F45
MSTYLEQLDKRASHLREVNDRICTRWLDVIGTDPGIDDAVAEMLRNNRTEAERIDQQVAWHRYINGEPVVWIPNGPAWRD